ncbi:hypothetical protein CGS55_04250 [Faecalibacterium prausnitzii]|uniref:Uncharacterized protein n=2 Tax=Faecalibacterium prausnitzii TaxID=853 RepID=A0A2A7AAA3_9FIRM|nr:hypothetical protein FAEPRAM212_01760 [Faecalibacterium prausnitzii M21/2]PDX73226.1 hypothetical protein CGS55_04250 [Faecalibacterium prausnitzii]PDX76060.1 hypothetical protein CGS56_05110 [Faecalibacterium prausnitzii]PDX84789.1 hypothetical protein CGS59_03595 [Faecalibacterium prausnitzii]
MLCSRHFSSSIIQNLVPFARGNMPAGTGEPHKRHYCLYTIIADSGNKVNANRPTNAPKIKKFFSGFVLSLVR